MVLTHRHVWEVKCALTGLKIDSNVIQRVAMEPARRHAKGGIQGNALMVDQVLRSMQKLAVHGHLSMDRKNWLRGMHS